MPVQWTIYVPQAMQRHGGSIRPPETAGADEAMAELLQSIRPIVPVVEPKAAAGPAVSPSSH